MKIVISFVVLLLSAGALAPAPRPDVAGSSDHPLLTRFPDSWIQSYRQTAYDEYVLPLGKHMGKAGFAHSEKLAGKYTGIEYRNEAHRSVIEIFENYQQAL
jgi:OOP family OmpA-OmpF porin